MVNIELLDKKNKEFKNLSLLQGFNLSEPPVIINDIMRLNNIVTLNNGDVIDEKIFIKFFGLVDNNKKDNAKSDKNKTRKKKSKIKNSL